VRRRVTPQTGYGDAVAALPCDQMSDRPGATVARALAAPRPLGLAPISSIRPKHEVDSALVVGMLEIGEEEGVDCVETPAMRERDL
jgi:hypothetical protein